MGGGLLGEIGGSFWDGFSGRYLPDRQPPPTRSLPCPESPPHAAAAAGIADGVLGAARALAARLEAWIDFPSPFAWSLWRPSPTTTATTSNHSFYSRGRLAHPEDHQEGRRAGMRMWAKESSAAIGGCQHLFFKTKNAFCGAPSWGAPQNLFVFLWRIC